MAATVYFERQCARRPDSDSPSGRCLEPGSFTHILTRMNKPQEPARDPGDDYRQSHLQRGATYDATIAADPFDAYMAQFERAYLLDAIPRLFPVAKPRYLDFACGTGRITQTVAPLCAEAVGVDVSPSMLAEARIKCPSVRFVEADITKSTADLGVFDLVTSFRFFGNAQQELRVAVLGALYRLLRPDGYLVINSHRNPQSLAALLNSLTGGGDHGMDLHYFKLKRLLRASGFEIVHSRPVGVWMYRHKLLQFARLGSAQSTRMEALFKHESFTPIAPDAVIVAKKAG